MASHVTGDVLERAICLFGEPHLSDSEFMATWPDEVEVS